MLRKSKTLNPLLKLSGQIIDLTYVHNQLKYPTETFHSLLKLLLQTLDESLPQLEQAYQQKDWCALQYLTHTLQGGAVYCGVLRLKEICHRIEDYLHSGKKRLISQLYNVLLEEIEFVKKEIQQFL